LPSLEQLRDTTIVTVTEVLSLNLPFFAKLSAGVTPSPTNRGNNMRLVAFLFGLIAIASTAGWAQDAIAVNLQSSCGHWAKLRVDKHKEFKGNPDDLYQTGVCVGYFHGLMDGMDNTGGWQLANGTTASFQINRSAINSTWDVIQSFYSYVDANPLAKGKPAWSVLQHVLTTNGLASFTPQAPPTQASALSNDCKAGVRNVETELNSDPDLKIIDTLTLASTISKLASCASAAGITDADRAAVSDALVAIQSVLLGRAAYVLDQHALLSEFKVNRSAESSTGSNAIRVIREH
jgi:hypothetical protein